MSFRKLPLDGVRVLTIDNYEAGNYGPMLLAMHGADVVKVEIPGKGDVLRSAGPFYQGERRTLSHGEIRLMRGKRSIELDIRTAEGRETFKQLIGQCDIFWTNLKRTSVERLGIGFDEMTALNPRLVYVSLTGFGLSGGLEYEDYPAFDIIVQGLAGLLHRNADSSGRPEYNGFPVGDQAASLFGVVGALLGLLRRDQKDEASLVDVAMHDAAIAFNEKALTVYGITHELPRQRASATSAPFGVYRVKDGFVSIGVGGNPVWGRFCESIGRPDLLEREDLSDGSDRVLLDESVLRPTIEQWASDKTASEVVMHLLASGVPSAPVLSEDDVARATYPRARGVIDSLVVDAGTDHEGEVAVVMSPIRIEGTGPINASAPPALGADTEQVIKEWLNQDRRARG